MDEATEFDEEEGEDDDEDKEEADEEEDDDEEGDIDASQRGPAPTGIHAEATSIPPPSPDPTFLQSFSALQMEVSGIRGDYTCLRNDVHHLSDRMDSIAAGVTYFRGFVDGQEEREQRRIQREEERAMREAQEYAERRRTNELLWRQSESLRQLEGRLHAFQGAPGGSPSFPPYDPSHASTFHPFPPHFWPPPGPDGPQ